MINNANILLIDDDKDIRKTLIELFKRESVIIFQAGTGKEALEIAAREEISLALIDLKLPDMSGLDILKKLKKSSPEIECIIVTGYASQETAIQAINAGVFSYFEKPYDVIQFKHSIHQALEKRRVRDLLSESQAKYKHLFENATVAMFRTKQDGSAFLEANLAFCNLFGYTRAELFLQRPTALWADPKSHKPMLEVMQKRGVVRNYRVDILKKSKEIRKCLASLKLNKQEGYLEGSIVDITDQVLLEEALRDSEERFSLAFKTSPYAITITKPENGQFLDINDAFTTMTGYTRKEALNSTSLSLDLWLNPEDREKVLKNAREGKKIASQEFEFKKKNGEILTGLFSTDILSLKGRQYLLSSINDISERKTAEKSIRESEARFKWLYDRAPIPYHILSPDGFIMDVNQRWCEVLGYSKEDAIGKEIFSFIADEEQEAARASFKKKKKSKQTFIDGSERRYRTKDGHIRTFKTFDNYVIDSKKNITLIQTTIEDITEHKQAEESHQRALERLRSLASILQYPAKNSQEFLDYALDEALRLTRSKLGYIYFFDETKQEFILNTWSKGVMKECSIVNPQSIYNLEKTGVWGEAVRQRKTILVNDFHQPNPLKKGYPPGHAPLDRFLTVPIFNDGKIVATIGVANKPTDYEESDALQLSLLMESVWKAVDRNQTVAALRDSETMLRNLINATKDIVILKDDQFKHIMVNQAAQAFFGRSEKEIIGKTDFDLMDNEAAKTCRLTDEKALEKNQLVINQENVGDGYFESRKFPVPLGSSLCLGMFIRDVTNQIKAEASIKLQSKALEATANAIVITSSDGLIEWVNPAFTQLTGYTAAEAVGQKPGDLVRSGMQESTFYSHMWETIQQGKIWKGVLFNRRKDGSFYAEEMTITPLLDETGTILHYIAIKQDVSEREQRERELTVIANVSAALRSAQTRAEMLPVILDQLIEQLNVEGATLILEDPIQEELVIELGRGEWAQATGMRIPKGKGLSWKIIESGETIIDNDNQNNPLVFSPHLFSACSCVVATPLVVQQKNIGALFIGSKRKMTNHDARLLNSIADIAANAIHRSTLHEQTEQKVEQLNSLRVIDQAINTSFDLTVTLNVILKQSLQLLGCSALIAFLCEPNTMWLKYAACTGSKCMDIRLLHLHMGSGIAGRAIAGRRIEKADRVEFDQLSENERIIANFDDFQSICAIPLTVKGAIKGVLIGLFSIPNAYNTDWFDIAQSLAAQTAIAIDNHELFDGLQQSTMNLSVAYNETIEGWAKALELRDQETEGHSQRVMKMTMNLAYEIGIKDEAIGDIIRGALLHDIGKMGIPDAILNKPGKLTDEEWQQVRKHPQYAYDMLSSIKYLKSALDIPYCHHEKWDGSGYPRGLKGEEIPLAARIFAVVDVWDALTSDRPYRKAWTSSKAKAYIQDQAGKHFDPRVVEIFFRSVLTNV